MFYERHRAQTGKSVRSSYVLCGAEPGSPHYRICRHRIRPADGRGAVWILDGVPDRGMDTERASSAMRRHGEADRDGICIAVTERDPDWDRVYDPRAAGGFLPPYESCINLLLSESFCLNVSGILLECLILFVVGFIPVAYNMAANALVSFACGIQVESFRKVRGNATSTTMCIGNLRSGTQAFCDFLFSRKKGCLVKVALYYGIILC